MPDAPPPPDTPDVDAATEGPVSLTIFEGTTARVGVKVLFQNADSSVVADTTTGTDGKATAVMKPGGFVTAFDPFPQVISPGGVAMRPDFRTFAGVKPGDQLKLFQPGPMGQGINVTFILPVDGNAAEYHISTNCMLGATIVADGSGGQPQASYQMYGCGATSNLLVEVFDSTLVPIKQIYKPSVALADEAVIDLTADTYTASTDTTYNFTNLPSGTTFASVYAIRATSLGLIDEFSTTTQITAGAGTFSERIPAVTGATAATISTFYGNSSFTQHIVAEWGAPGNYALDGANLLLGEFDADATIDGATSSIKWTATGGAAQPDLVNVRAFLNRDVAGNTMSWSWEIAAPAVITPGSNVMQAKFPVLPDSPYNLQTGDFGGWDVRVAKVPGGYDAVRDKILALSNLQDIAVGATGKAVFAYLVVPEARKRPTVPSFVRGRTQTRR